MITVDPLHQTANGADRTICGIKLSKKECLPYCGPRFAQEHHARAVANAQPVCATCWAPSPKEALPTLFGAEDLT